MRRFPNDGRFEVSGDPHEVTTVRHVLWKRTRLAYQYIARGFSPKDDAYWLGGTDRQTGQRVYIHPRGFTYAWVHDLAIETVAQRVKALALRHTVPVLHVGPGIVYAAPPPAARRPSLPLEAAAACAQQACDVAARLHEQGCGRLSFGPSHLRLVQESGDWQIRWLVPGEPELDLLEALEIADDRTAEVDHPRWRWPYVAPIPYDLWQLAFFFFSLLAPDARTGRDLDADRREALRMLMRIRDEGPEAAGLHDAATMAGLFALLARSPTLSAKPLPVVRVFPRLYPDWDEVIVDGEALLKEIRLEAKQGSDLDASEHIQLPLAAAYHQRASRSWARGDLEAALGDVDRALELDDHAPYHTTRAVLLDALGRRAEARAAISTAFEVDARPEETWSGGHEVDVDKNVERARAHLTRGIIALREGSVDLAEADVCKAEELHRTPLATRARAAVARARAAR